MQRIKTKATPPSSSSDVDVTQQAGNPTLAAVRVRWTKLALAVLLTYYAVTIVIPPNPATPATKPVGGQDTPSANKDAFVADGTVTLAAYGGAGGLCMLLITYALPLHLLRLRPASPAVPHWVPRLAARMTRVRAAALRFPHARVSPLYVPLSAGEAVAAVLSLCGVALRQWAFATLKDKFTYAVRIFHDHELIAAGPYATLLHPGYTGLLMALGGLFFYMGFRNSRMVALMLVYMIPLYFRMVNEEAVLEGHFGKEQWGAHAKGKYRLVPYLW